MKMLFFLLLYCSIASTGDLKEEYRFGSFPYTILGITKMEGILDGIQEIAQGDFQLIGGHDFAHTKWVINKEGKMVSIHEITELPFCYEFESYPIFRIMNEDELEGIKNNGTVFSANMEKTARVCSYEYSAWFNTTIINYVFSNPEISAKYKPDYCIQEYTLEYLDIFQLWDESGQPVDGMPQRPW